MFWPCSCAVERFDERGKDAVVLEFLCFPCRSSCLSDPGRDVKLCLELSAIQAG